MSSFFGISLRDLRPLCDRRLITAAAIGGGTCVALLIAFATRPSAQTVDAGVLGSAPVASDAAVPAASSCARQHWPYLDRQCLTGVTHAPRRVRRVTTDRLAAELPGLASPDTEAVAAMDADATQADLRATSTDNPSEAVTGSVTPRIAPSAGNAKRQAGRERVRVRIVRRVDQPEPSPRRMMVIRRGGAPRVYDPGAFAYSPN